jgi:hypothetical protein
MRPHHTQKTFLSFKKIPPLGMYTAASTANQVSQSKIINERLLYTVQQRIQEK